MSIYERPIDMFSLEELTRSLHLEECRSSSYRRSWLKERTRTKAATLKLRIIKNDTSPMILKKALPDRIFIPHRLKCNEDTLLAIRKEKVWSIHYFNGWIMERTQRKKLEWEITLSM